MQLVHSVRRPDGMPATKVLAHLGAFDEVLHANLKAALAASRNGTVVKAEDDSVEGERDRSQDVAVCVRAQLVYLPFAVVSRFFRQAGLKKILDDVELGKGRAARLSEVVETLVVHRCLEPGSKLAFQRWIANTAVNEILGVSDRALNNTRVHRGLDELAQVDAALQDHVASAITAHGVPQVLYLDLTDTWFDAGGGSLSRRAPTKAGHRSRRKIHVALLVNETGLPMRWSLLPGALSETTVLPGWIDELDQREWSERAVLIFDRGMSCIENLKRLVGTGELEGPKAGRPFLTSVKADLISRCLDLDPDLLDQLQSVSDDAPASQITSACRALGLDYCNRETYVLDLGVRQPPVSRARSHSFVPAMRMYLYFNREIQRGKREGRHDRMAKAVRLIDKLNQELRLAQKSRQQRHTLRKVNSILEKLKLLEIFTATLVPFDIPGSTTTIKSFQVKVDVRDDMLRFASRYDGVTLLLGHPKLQMTAEQAIMAYRHKNVVESDFRTIKSVLLIRPTFHWTDAKIKSHVTICILALLVERLIEAKLPQASSSDSEPRSADALLRELASVQLHRLRVNGTDHTSRTWANPRTKTLLRSIGALDLLDACPETVTVTQNRR